MNWFVTIINNVFHSIHSYDNRFNLWIPFAIKIPSLIVIKIHENWISAQISLIDLQKMYIRCKLMWLYFCCHFQTVRRQLNHRVTFRILNPEVRGDLFRYWIEVTNPLKGHIYFGFFGTLCMNSQSLYEVNKTSTLFILDLSAYLNQRTTFWEAWEKLSGDSWHRVWICGE